MLVQIAFAAPTDDFVITINSGGSPTEFTIPTTGSGYNYSVDCNNDGTNEATGVTGDYTCDYAALGGAGTYTIRIKDPSGGSGGTGFPRINIGSSTQSNRSKLLSIDQWGTGIWTSMQSAFFGTGNMDVVATDTPNLSMVGTLFIMFSNTNSLIGASANWNWDVSNVTNMRSMFRSSQFNQDISNWDVSNVTTMDGMFEGASAFNQDISAWDVSNVANFEDFLTDAKLSLTNYDALLTAWDGLLDLTDDLVFDGGNSQYCNATIARIDIILNDRWVINDAGQATNCPFTGSSIITVGPAGSSCDITVSSTKIQDAIDFGPNTIRLVNTETYNENIIIDDIDIDIVGGYANCADAANGIRNPDDKSIINGSSSTQSTIRVFGNSQFNTVNLTGLDITGGTSNALGGGGLVAFGADAEITLRNVSIHDNTGRFGGGIAIIASNNRTNLLAVDTIINNNSADEGGGLYCKYVGTGIKPIITFSLESGISDNSATVGDGGGVYLSQGCGFTFASGSADILSDIGINRNTATRNGGGIYAESESTVNLVGNVDGCGFLCIGDNTNPVTVASNSALEDGGGVYATGFMTSITMESVYLTANQVGQNGGGIALIDTASLLIKRSQKECWDENHCNFLTSNKSGINSGLGGLIYNNSSTANINQAEIAFNRADFGTVLYGTGVGSITTMNGDIIRDNSGPRFGAFSQEDNYVFRVTSGAQVDVYHSTIADNAAVSAVFGIAANAGSASEIRNSIIHDSSSGDILDVNFGPVDITSCILHEKLSLNLLPFPIPDDLRVDDPRFVDRVGNNYHIDPINSPAIDFATSNQSTLPDMDFETRGNDYTEVTDFFGPFDVGADEAYKPDEMFSDGFEN